MDAQARKAWLQRRQARPRQRALDARQCKHGTATAAGDAHVIQCQRRVESLPARLDAADRHRRLQRCGGDALDAWPHRVDIRQQPVAQRQQQQPEREEARHQRPAKDPQAEPHRAQQHARRSAGRSTPRRRAGESRSALLPPPRAHARSRPRGHRARAPTSGGDQKEGSLPRVVNGLDGETAGPFLGSGVTAAAGACRSRSGGPPVKLQSISQPCLGRASGAKPIHSITELPSSACTFPQWSPLTYPRQGPALQPAAFHAVNNRTPLSRLRLARRAAALADVSALSRYVQPRARSGGRPRQCQCRSGRAAGRAGGEAVDRTAHARGARCRPLPAGERASTRRGAATTASTRNAEPHIAATSRVSPTCTKSCRRRRPSLNLALQAAVAHLRGTNWPWCMACRAVRTARRRTC